ncbi:hypothetical protein [Maribacter sp.]|uniref:hypothetical protein n=1 Tax=Maribacter sp. TaxID=1897614 RepID=UPI0025B99462|nr:hypothetical protein [Maribacter sp.]
MSYKDPNDLRKVQTYTAPVVTFTNTLPTANTPSYIPGPTNTGGSNFWATIGNIINTADRYVGPLINKNKGYRTSTSGNNVNLQPQAQQQVINGQNGYQYANNTPPQKTDNSKLLIGGAIAVVAVGVGVYLFKK